MITQIIIFWWCSSLILTSFCILEFKSALIPFIAAFFSWLTRIPTMSQDNRSSMGGTLNDFENAVHKYVSWLPDRTLLIILITCYNNNFLPTCLIREIRILQLYWLICLKWTEQSEWARKVPLIRVRYRFKWGFVNVNIETDRRRTP